MRRSLPRRLPPPLVLLASRRASPLLASSSSSSLVHLRLPPSAASARRAFSLSRPSFAPNSGNEGGGGGGQEAPRNPFRVFVETLKFEIEKNRELQANVKQLQGDVGKLQDSESLRKAKELYERARITTLLKNNPKLQEAADEMKRSGVKVSDAVGEALRQVEESEFLRAVRPFPPPFPILPLHEAVPLGEGRLPHPDPPRRRRLAPSRAKEGLVRAAWAASQLPLASSSLAARSLASCGLAGWLSSEQARACPSRRRRRLAPFVPRSSIKTEPPPPSFPPLPPPPAEKVARRRLLRRGDGDGPRPQHGRLQGARRKRLGGL